MERTHASDLAGRLHCLVELWFEAGKKVHKRALEQRIKEMEEQEVAFTSHNWPWDTEEELVRYPPLA